MNLALTINLGQLLEIASVAVAAIWAVAKMSAQSDEFFRTLERHEDTLNKHERRLNEHGERISAIRPERRSH